jgi:uncharacterized SAM-binding protein YcdF (DUF218 family)
MFLASKTLSFLTQPLAWVVAMLLVAGLVSPRHAVAGRRLVWCAMALLLLLGWQPLPDVVLHRLEAQYAEMAPQADLSGFEGMVVLGGAMESGYVAQGHLQPQLTDGAERMLAPIAALQRNAQLRILFTGGEGTLFGTGPSEAERARLLFDSLGVPRQRVLYESASRTTYENAVFTARLAEVDRGRRWLLVTSAYHMPRSMATFVKAGWNVTAYPVDFRTGSATPWTEYSLRESLGHWQIALHEVVGMLAYRLSSQL